MNKATLLLLFQLFLFTAYSQGIKGTVYDESGLPLPNVSVYIQELASGTATNLDGDFLYVLEPGTYQIQFHFIGYKTVVRKVEIGGSFVKMMIDMVPRTLTLATVNVSDKAEDPAYTIMRKAIAKARFHQLQVNQYDAEVYIKGTGKMVKIPFLFRKALREEGIDTNRVYTSESVSKIHYEYPSTFSEKVISVRTSGKNEMNANPNQYIGNSFYNPQVIESISPLSPRAFSYYRFKFLGSFIDQGYEINKIQVIPRAKGENIFTGTIYIRENYYNIHSLDLRTTIQGFGLNIIQHYTPVKEEVWMPVTQIFKFEGSIFGFSLRYDYLASLSNYDIVVNPDLQFKVDLVDEKIDPVPEDAFDYQKEEADSALSELKEKDKKITRKEFDQLIDEYEKQEEETQKKEQDNEPEISGDYSYTVDKDASNSDSTYWENKRTIPLTEKEKEAYEIDDSTFVADVDYRRQDSLRKENGDPLKFGALFTGGYYKLSKDLRFRFDGFLPHFQFNTVEGWNLAFSGDLFLKNDSNTRFKLRPYIRYGFDSEQAYGKADISFGFNEGLKRSNVFVSAGKYIYQFNPKSIDPLINSLYTLLLVRNYMRLYEKEQVLAHYNTPLGYKWNASISAEWSSRSELFNNSGWSLVDRKNYRYQLNEPENIETTTGGFKDNVAFKTKVSFSYQPWLKFYKYNGKIRKTNTSSTRFRGSYTAAWNNVMGSTNEFHQLELGITTAFKLGIKSRYHIDLSAGSFLSQTQLEFMDYKHFDGGLTEIAPLELTGNYRVLDYYYLSTAKNYASLLSHITIRKFIFTQIPTLRLIGLKENLILNYLKTSTSPHYYEIGYGIDNIFRVMRIELVHSFMDDQLGDFGVRIGLTTSFN